MKYKKINVESVHLVHLALESEAEIECLRRLSLKGARSQCTSTHHSVEVLHLGTRQHSKIQQAIIKLSDLEELLDYMKHTISAGARGSEFRIVDALGVTR